jgi:hypothetical protein
VQQVRPAGGRALEPLLVTPPGDRSVVPGEKDRGNVTPPVPPVPAGRLGVDGILQQPLLMGLLDERLGVADDAGQQARDRLDDRQHRHLAAVEHVVAE